MADRYPYTTHTAPPLVLDIHEEDGIWIVTLAGDNIKELGQEWTKEAALKIADAIYAHYEERKQAEA